MRVVVCLGKIAWDGYLAHLLHCGVIAKRSAYPFSHGAEYLLPNGMRLLGSYHPSLRNTNTGRLDRAMFTRVFVRARERDGAGCLKHRSMGWFQITSLVFLFGSLVVVGTIGEI